MIIVLKEGTTAEQIKRFSDELTEKYNVTVNAWYGTHSTVLGLLGATSSIDSENIEAQDIVDNVKLVS